MPKRRKERDVGRSDRRSPFLLSYPAFPARYSISLRWYCRVDESGVDVIDSWGKIELTKKARARFERARDQLSRLPYAEWKKPLGAKVQGHDHIYVIRFHDETRKQWRVFGYADTARNGFVMTNTAFENDYKYIPGNAPNRASQHRLTVSAEPDRYSRLCYST